MIGAEESSVMSAEEAARMVAELKRFGVHHSKSEIVDVVLNTGRNIEQVKFENRRKLKQSKVTNFFIQY